MFLVSQMQKEKNFFTPWVVLGGKWCALYYDMKLKAKLITHRQWVCQLINCYFHLPM